MAGNKLHEWATTGGLENMKIGDPGEMLKGMAPKVDKIQKAAKLISKAAGARGAKSPRKQKPIPPNSRPNTARPTSGPTKPNRPQLGQTNAARAGSAGSTSSDNRNPSQFRALPRGTGTSAGSFTHHDVLGVKPGASAAEIKSAYRRAARKYHPDYNKAPEAKSMFEKVTKAYNSLNTNNL